MHSATGNASITAETEPELAEILATHEVNKLEIKPLTFSFSVIDHRISTSDVLY